MDFYIVIGILTLACAAVVWGFIRAPELKKFLPFIRYLIQTVAFSIRYWQLSEYYAKSFDAAAKFSILLETLPLNDLDLNDPELRKKISQFVRDNYQLLYDSSEDRDVEAEKLAAGAFVLIISNEKLRTSIQALIEGRPEDIEVKKLTVICIDLFALLFNLRDKLSLEYYQHLIYAINRVLVTVRDEGFTEKGIKDAGAIMFRMYKVTLAFRKQQSYNVKEFYETINKMLDTFFSR